MSRMRLAGLHPVVRDAANWCLELASYYNVPVTVTSGHRSWAEQARLRRNFEQCVAAGRYPSAPDCLFPANRPGDSAHNFGLAWDSTTEPWAQEWWNRVREYAGFHVPPNDLIHAEVPSWRQYASGAGTDPR